MAGENKTPWQEFSESRANHLGAAWKLSHLPIDQRVEALSEGLKAGKITDFFYFLKTTEDPSYRGIKRPVSEAMLDYLGDVAAFPGDNSPLAVNLLKALPPQAAGRIEAMLDRKTAECIGSEDEEIWIYTAVLLREFSSDRFKSLMERSLSHPLQKIKEVAAFFEEDGSIEGKRSASIDPQGESALSEAMNTFTPCLSILAGMGFRITAEFSENRAADWHADDGKLRLSASSPLALLGLAYLREKRGKDWRRKPEEPDLYSQALEGKPI